MSVRQSTKKHHKSKKGDSTLTKIFRLYDEDKDGFVDFVYLPEMMRSAGAIFMDSDLERPMETIRTNNGADIFNHKDFVEERQEPRCPCLQKPEPGKQVLRGHRSFQLR